MKIDWNKKYNTIAAYVFIVVCAVILFYLAVSQLGVVLDKINSIVGIFKPFIMGFAIAYILDFILRFYENSVFKLSFFKKFKMKSKRGIGILFEVYFNV